MDLSPERLQELGVDDPGVLALRQWRKEGRVDALVAVAVDREASNDSRFWATRFLGSFQDDRAVAALVDVLGDADEGLRSQAADALAKIGKPDAVPALARAAFDADGGVRISAVKALGEIGDQSAIPTLMQVAETTSWGLLHEWVAASLAKLNAPEAAELLVHYLDGPADADTHWIRRANKKMHWTPRWAAKELGRLGTRDAIEPLRQARQRDLLHRRIYTRAIKAIERRHPG